MTAVRRAVQSFPPLSVQLLRAMRSLDGWKTQHSQFKRSKMTASPRSLLSMATLNIAKSRVRPSICNLVRIDQTCFGRRGGFAPINLPLFQATGWRDQPAGFGILAEGIDRGHRVAHRQGRELYATVDKQRVGMDQECVRPAFAQGLQRPWSMSRLVPTDSAFGLFGLTSRPKRAAPGSSSQPRLDRRDPRIHLSRASGLRQEAGPRLRSSR
jgi:hypothetical protein